MIKNIEVNSFPMQHILYAYFVRKAATEFIILMQSKNLKSKNS